MQFHPTGGKLTIEPFDEGGFLAIVKLEFQEPADPDDPKSKDRASVTLDLPFAEEIAADWQSLAGQTFSRKDLEAADEVEGSIYYCGYHNPVGMETIKFGKFTSKQVAVKIIGEIDFTYEGLAKLGQPTFHWQTKLSHSLKKE